MAKSKIDYAVIFWRRTMDYDLAAHIEERSTSYIVLRKPDGKQAGVDFDRNVSRHNPEFAKIFHIEPVGARTVMLRLTADGRARAEAEKNRD